MKDIQYMPRLVLRIKSTDIGTCVISFESSTVIVSRLEERELFNMIRKRAMDSLKNHYCRKEHEAPL